MLVRSAVAALSGTLLPACLTQNVQYENPRNYPPSIETPDTAQFPLNQIIQLPGDLEVEGDGGVTTLMSIPFVFDVRDPNLDQRLEFRVFVDYVAGMTGQADAVAIVPVSPTAADRLTRRVEYSLPIGFVSSPGCHRVEVLVSGSFPAGGRRPLDEGDLATATWWVASGADANDAVDMRGCR